MRFTGLILMTTLTAIGFAQEEENKHTLSTHIMYKTHKEIGYKYTQSCMGFGYDYKQEVGFNYSLHVFTNFKNENGFGESTQTISYLIPVSEDHSFFPVFSSFHSNHNVQNFEDRNDYISKSSLSLGLGWKWIVDDILTITTEFSPFKDMQNSYIMIHGNEYLGKNYTNPIGMGAKINVIANIEDFIEFDFGVFAKKTLTKCYKEYGFIAAINGRF